MKVSLNWLREFVELPATTEQLVNLLTLAGVEVEGVEQRGVAIPNVVVAEIVESKQHPNADRLSVCNVNDGSAESRQIVCGAKNYKVGDHVPLALPGAVLPGDFKIKVGKLRGVESQGMLCSAEELGLPKGPDGLLILPHESKPGTAIGELFPGDTILDLEITPNRSDLLSVVGIAREISALSGKPLRFPTTEMSASAGVGSVEVATLACPFYTARKISGIKVGPSPAWLRTKLEAVGLRAINNIVDITNFVMLELGQPLHAFDADKLDGDIRVRMAAPGEQLPALDGRTYQLAPEHVVIADSRQPLALGGVMGGEASGVTEQTRNLILESAVFDPATIRRTSRALGLMSDSSYRFERGVDVAGVAIASERATALIIELAGGNRGECFTGTPSSAVSSPSDASKKVIPLRAERVAALLGVSLTSERIEQILRGFGLRKGDTGWEVPSFRPDLTREVDLVEEIARVTGIDAIPSREQSRFAPSSATDREYDRTMEVRRACVAQGLHEARSLTLVPAQPLGVAFTRVNSAHVRRVRNPMIDDQVVLRPNLLHGLLAGVRANIRAGSKVVRLFEVGRVYSTQAPEESTHLAFVATGAIAERSWRATEAAEGDLFHVKGMLEAILSGDVSFESDNNPALALSLAVKLAGKAIGWAGQLWPADARELDATAPVLFAEVELTKVFATPARAKRYREIPKFPATARDIAVVAASTVSHEELVRVLREAKEPLLTDIELFDVFTDLSGEKLPADKKSLAYSLTYRASDRTLTADEVNAAHARLKERLKSALGVTLRE